MKWFFVAALVLNFSLAHAVEPRSSLYDLDSQWTDQDGQSVNLADLRGRPQVVAMFFSSCTYACPLITADMKKVAAESPENVGFVMASFDTERDTPEKLKDFAARNNIASHRWKFLHGGEETVRDLAAALGVRYRRDEEGDFSHSNIITLLDENGVILFQREGLGGDLSELIKAAQDAGKRPAAR